MRLLLIYFSLFFIPIFKGHSQSTYGSTIDSISGIPLKKAKIIVYGDSKILFATLSDSLGRFIIPTTSYFICSRIELNFLGYEKFIYTKKVLDNNLEKLNINLGIFKLSPIGINLQEVVITKRKRKYRDTLHIELSNEHFERNVMIEDFLSNQKGFTKGVNGKLFFNGKEVSDVVLNGGNFYGKNNLDIYKYLPALTLNNIEIIETDVDSLTNTVVLKPTIKVNLMLKDKFKNGKFGSLNLGYGTSNRNLIATDLYKYKSNEQISLVLNTNNINSGDNPYIEPNVNFSPNGNNFINRSAKLSYRNLYNRGKIEVEASIKPKFENRKFNSEIFRQEENINQFSKTSSNSTSKVFGLESTRLSVNYRIDSLNTILINQSIDYNITDQKDTLAYEIQYNDINKQSQVSKIRKLSKLNIFNTIQYIKRFANKRGRSISFDVSMDQTKYDTQEENNIYAKSTQNSIQYYINGSRFASQKKNQFNIGFIEPLGDNGILNFITSYKTDLINYNEESVSDSIINFPYSFNSFYNSQLISGVKLQKTLNKFSFDSRVLSIINLYETEKKLNIDKYTSYNLDISANIDYTINKKNNLSAHYTTKINYPNISQLTSINNSFDLISQIQGNILLRPEIGKRIETIYNFKKNDSLILSFNGAVEFFSSKYGFNIINIPNEYQINFIDNIGHSNSYEASLFMLRLFKNGKNINYKINTKYSENPLVNNQVRFLSSTTTINQSFSSNFILFDNFTISPTFSVILALNKYNSDQSKMSTIIYSDKISLNLPKVVTLNLYPLINYSKNLTNNTNWAINGEIRRSFFKNYGAAWIKAYDIFNSFNYINNFFGNTYTQSERYTNTSRYILFGISLRFNNMR